MAHLIEKDFAFRVNTKFFLILEINDKILDSNICALSDSYDHIRCVTLCLSSLVAHSGGSQEAPVVLWSPPNTHSSVLASAAVVSGASGSGGGQSSGAASVPGSSASAPLSLTSSGGVRAVPSCLETIQRFAQAKGFSKHVAKQSALARRPSSLAGYQAHWSIFRQWCHGKGHSVSRPSLQKIADFLFWLRRSKKLSISAVLGYRSMLSAVFRRVLPEVSTSPVIQDLLRSFKVEAPCRAVRPPAWDLLKVLTYLRSSVFELLSQASFRDLSRKTLFLLALATAKHVGELQALSRFVSFSSSAADISYVPEFIAKTETAVRSLPRSFSILSLGDFAAGLPEDLLLGRQSQTSTLELPWCRVASKGVRRCLSLSSSLLRF